MQQASRAARTRREINVFCIEKVLCYFLNDREAKRRGREGADVPRERAR
jgi:hypothetical protein